MEHEIHGHAQKAYEAMKNKNESFWHKVKEVLVEVGIIVFAITLSMWFHNWSEHKHEQKQVKLFLFGLKKDIADDIDQCTSCVKAFHLKDSVLQLAMTNPDSLEAIAKNYSTDVYNMIFSNMWLRQNTNRYEGFKNSGKVENIENEELAQEILFYFQQGTSQLKSSENGWLSRQESLRNFWEINIKEDENDLEKGLSLLQTSKGKRLTKQLLPWQQLYDRYDTLMSSGKRIIELINNEYDVKD
jgi:hypothetical protein